MSNLSELANSLTPEDIIKLVTELGADRYIETDNYIQFPTICHNVDPSEAKMKLYYYKKNKKSNWLLYQLDFFYNYSL